MVVNGRPLKRARMRAAAAELRDFLGFPSAGDSAGVGGEVGTFRAAVRGFLARHARLLPLPSIFSPAAAAAPPHLLTWRVSFSVGGGEEGGVELNVVEEDVLRSRSVYCDQCRVVGWSGHPVCGKRYHFIIENDSNQMSGCRQTCCLRCGTPMPASESRKVTVMDISRKYGMDYRLLHAITSGHPWYGEWGYKFGAGSYALTADSYQEAVDTLSGINLSLYFSHRESTRTQLQNTIALYWSLSDRQLVTVRDLFRFIMHLLHEAHKNSELSKPKIDEHEEAASNVLCMWTREDVERAEAAMVKVLRAVEAGRWVSWRALRGATSKAVGSQELLDYSLRGLGGKLTDHGHVVAVRCNAETSAIEYRLETASNQPPVNSTSFGPCAEHLLRDLKFLHDALLNPDTMQYWQPQVVRASSHSAAAKILDCKQFIKHYDEHASQTPSNPFLLCVRCSVELVDHQKDYTAPPPELVLIPASATIAELKLQASRAFQETYVMFQSFQAEQLPDLPDVSETTPVKLVLGSTELVRVRGRCTGDHRRLGQFRMERGLENWTVDCTCGAKDDDGERMMACDSCGVWQHTRCSGISDFEEVPAKFICRKCTSPRKGKGRSSGGGGSGGGRMEVSTKAFVNLPLAPWNLVFLPLINKVLMLPIRFRF